MHEMRSETPASQSTPHFQLGSGLWNNVYLPTLASIVAEQTCKAERALIAHGISVPGEARLRLIAMAAAEAVYLLFQAALHEPSPENLEHFFTAFVLAAIHDKSDHETTF
jgi:hypothetical protein